MRHPLQQGLRPLRDISPKVELEEAQVRHPLQQGLRRLYGKTISGLLRYPAQVRHPLQQGLRLTDINAVQITVESPKCDIHYNKD